MCLKYEIKVPESKEFETGFELRWPYVCRLWGGILGDRFQLGAPSFADVKSPTFASTS